MEAYNLLPPEFLDERGSFIVKFYKKSIVQNQYDDLIDFCRTPRSRQEICDFLGIKTPFYAIKQYVQPLIDSGKIKLLIPDVPGSHKQKYYSAE